MANYAAADLTAGRLRGYRGRMDPVCFHIGSRPIYWFGVLTALGFAAALCHWSRLAKIRGKAPEYASDIVLWIMVGGVLGARLAYVLANWPEYAGDLLGIVRIDRGGLIYYGGLLGGSLAMILLARRRREPLFGLADFVISGVPLGHALGRVGCFLNGCCHGTPTGHWIGSLTRGVHPAQLYEAAGNLVIYYILAKHYPRRRFDGHTLCLYLVMYAGLRFMNEFFRGDERQRMGGISVAQWMSMSLLLCGVFGWRVLSRRGATQGHEHDPHSAE